MAKAKSKDEVKAELAEEEIKDVTIKDIKETDPKAAKELDEGGTVVDANEAAVTTEDAEKPKVAKAGKRSAKAAKESEEKVEKEARKAKPDTDETVKKGPAPKTRSKLDRRSKNYRKSAELIDKTKVYTVAEAMGIIPKTSTVKFDASVELHVNLNVDPRQADQNIRSMVVLPNGSGKTVRVAVFAPADQHEAAKKAGADIVGEDEFLQKLDKEQLDFDILIATPQLMAKLGKYARVLGPKGLMPNPKSGTVTAKVAEAVKEAKTGKVEFRVDKQGIIHQAVGKVSFSPDALVANAEAVLQAIADTKPGSVKGAFIEKISLTTTMGPSLTITLN